MVGGLAKVTLLLGAARVQRLTETEKHPASSPQLGHQQVPSHAQGHVCMGRA